MEFFEYPQLRPDLELLLDHPQEPTAALLYDPARRDLYELDAADLPLLALLDGTRAPIEIARQSGRPLDEVYDLLDDLSDLMLLRDPEQEELLQDWQEQLDAEDDLLQPALEDVPLPDLAQRAIHVVDDARHTCLCCGACCHYAVPISPEERALLEGADWPEEVVPQEAEHLFQKRPGQQWEGLEEVIATRSRPTRCAFLDEEMLCRVHLELGPQAKPFACRLFPLAYPVVTPDRILFSLTFECPHIYQTYDDGERLADRSAELRALAEEMEQIYLLPEEIPLYKGAVLPRKDYLAWEAELLEDLPPPASDPAGLLQHLADRWAEIAPPDAPPPLAGQAAFQKMAQALRRALREHWDTATDTPEGEAGTAWAAQILSGLSEDPKPAWAAWPWTDAAAADRFLRRFVRHFVAGKQHLFYRNLHLGLRALALHLLLARCDAVALAESEGEETISLPHLNRALSRWCRLFDLRPLRLAFL